ncbi:hypothetical protein MMC17_001237 [Xylographa soralifera]|nr:hypothetical protein [Xylographa soralifera]
MIASGMGRHLICLPPDQVISMLEWSALSEPVSVIGIGVIKISVCLCLIRVVDKARRKLTRFLWFLIAFIIVTHLGLAMVFFFHCIPLAKLWNPEIEGRCMSTNDTVLAGYIGFGADILTDLVCAGIPIFVIHRLQMNNRTKIALCCLMGLGVFTAGCAVAKAVTLVGVFADDYTWGFTQPATWAAIEQFVGIIITSLPALRLQLSNVFERITISLPSSAAFHKIHSAYKHLRTSSNASSTTGIEHKKQILKETDFSISIDSEREKSYAPNYFHNWEVPDPAFRRSELWMVV